MAGFSEQRQQLRIDRIDLVAQRLELVALSVACREDDREIAFRRDVDERGDGAAVRRAGHAVHLVDEPVLLVGTVREADLGRRRAPV